MREKSPLSDFSRLDVSFWYPLPVARAKQKQNLRAATTISQKKKKHNARKQKHARCQQTHDHMRAIAKVKEKKNL